MHFFFHCLHTMLRIIIPNFHPLYLTSIPTRNPDRFGFSSRSETYACNYIAMQVLLFDTILSTLLRYTYQNRTEGTRKFHISERFLLTVRRVTWDQLCVRAVFLCCHANIPFI